MSQTITKDSVLKILEGRFDYQSARNVMERALKEAGLAKKDSLGADDVESFCEALESFSTSVTSINEALRNTVGGGGAKKEAPKKEAPKKEEAKKPEPKKEEAKKPEPKKEEAKKPAAKKPASRKSSTTDKKAAAKKDDDKADDKKKK